MAAPESVKHLIETFGNNLDFYKSSQYNEAQLRQEFLDPFFKELGWDMDNTAGLAPQYRDVIHEASIKIGGSTKAPDYAFSIHGQYKFFLEAKKPAVNLHQDTDPAYQLRRYGWSAKLPISILTDFEEFAIYDCRKKPSRGERASTSRLGYFKFTDYIEKWDELCATFSKDAILKGSFDKYTVDSKRHRGTETVDDAFLAEIENWRNLLARNFALRNPTLSVRDLNFAVQKTIDRLIFLRICEDRGTEDYKRLATLLNGERIYPRLLDQFMQADARYNSGLFHFSAEKNRGAADNITPNLDLDDRVLKEILSKLYYPDSPYEFSVLPADILGQVYEQFLGKTIQLTAGHQAKIEEKPEVRKAGGVYYTPSYIVDYIVKNTLGRQLDGNNPQKPKPIATSKAAEIKVLDPACGSGSFLIVAYQYLLNWHLRQYTADPETNEPDQGKIKRHSGGKKPKIYQAPGGAWKLTTDERKRILLNNIHGVDIDAQAVEVTKLSLLLKVIEGETQQVLQRDWIRERQRILPDLESNIKCGNSLIGPDFYDNEQMLLLDEETQYRINVFDWKTAFPKIMQRGGFDCVIGNPPYIRIQAMKEWAPQEVNFYSRNFVAAGAGNFDIYVCFIEKALGLVKVNGKMGYIVPHKFFQTKYGAPIRRHITKGGHLSEIVNFGHEQVFESASTYTCLLFLSSAPSESFSYSHVSDLANWRNEEKAETGILASPDESDAVWNFSVGPGAGLLEKLGRMPCKLGDISNMFVGLQTSADTVFLFKDYLESTGKTAQVFSKELNTEVEIETDILKPVIRSGRIGRYTAEPTAAVLFPYSVANGKASLLGLNEIQNRFPLAADYLTRNKELLAGREHGKFAETGWHQLYPKNLHLWEEPKIMVPYMVTRLAAFYDPDSCYFVNVTTGGFGLRTNGFAGNDLFITGLLNSKLLNFFFIRISTTFRGGYYAANKQFLAQLPIRPIDFGNADDVSKHDKMVGLVERMLELNKKKAAENNPETLRLLETQLAATDRQIDRLVYELYNLTDDEIALVEGNG